MTSFRPQMCPTVYGIAAAGCLAFFALLLTRLEPLSADPAETHLTPRLVEQRGGAVRGMVRLSDAIVVAVGGRAHRYDYGTAVDGAPSASSAPSPQRIVDLARDQARPIVVVVTAGARGGQLLVLDEHSLRLVGHLPLEGMPHALAYFSDTAWVTVGDTVHIVDIGHASQPRRVGIVELGGRVVDLAVDGSLAALLTVEGLHRLRLFDVTVPREPRALGDLWIHGAPQHVDLRQGRAAVLGPTMGLSLLNVTAPDRPQVSAWLPRGRLPDGASDAADVRLRGEEMWILGRGGQLWRLSVDSSNRATVLSTTSLGAPCAGRADLRFSGARAYACLAQGAIAIVGATATEGGRVLERRALPAFAPRAVQEIGGRPWMLDADGALLHLDPTIRGPAALRTVLAPPEPPAPRMRASRWLSGAEGQLMVTREDGWYFVHTASEPRAELLAMEPEAVDGLQALGDERFVSWTFDRASLVSRDGGVWHVQAEVGLEGGPHRGARVGAEVWLVDASGTLRKLAPVQEPRSSLELRRTVRMLPGSGVGPALAFQARGDLVHMLHAARGGVGSGSVYIVHQLPASAPPRTLTALDLPDRALDVELERHVGWVLAQDGDRGSLAMLDVRAPTFVDEIDRVGLGGTPWDLAPAAAGGVWIAGGELGLMRVEAGPPAGPPAGPAARLLLPRVLRSVP